MQYGATELSTKTICGKKFYRICRRKLTELVKENFTKFVTENFSDNKRPHMRLTFEKA